MIYYSELALGSIQLVYSDSENDCKKLWQTYKHLQHCCYDVIRVLGSKRPEFYRKINRRAIPYSIHKL